MNTAPFFDHYFKNAEVNSIMVMDSDGIVLDVNSAFSKNFGYKKGEIAGKSFKILFSEADQQLKRPEIELEQVRSTGQANDESYVLDNRGKEIWCTGESLLVLSGDGEKYIVKDIVNLQSKKHIQVLLSSTEQLLQRIFESSSDVPMMILDGLMKIQNVNKSFLDLFEITKDPKPESRLVDLDHPFWRTSEIKKALTNFIVANEPLISNEFVLHSQSGLMKLIKIDPKIIEGQSTQGRRIFLIVEDITPKIKNNSLRSHNGL